MRDPPPYASIDPATMTDRELDEEHRLLADWVQEALSALRPGDAPDDETYDAVYDELSQISRERASRQRDDRRGFPLRPV